MALRPPTASARVSTASPSTINATNPLRIVPAPPTTGPRPMLELSRVESDGVEPLGKTKRSGAVVLTVVDSVVAGGVVLVVVVEGHMVLVVLLGVAIVEGEPVVVIVLPMVVLGEVVVVVVTRALCCAAVSTVPMGGDAVEAGEGRVVVVVEWSFAFLEVLFCLLVLLLTFLLVLRTTGGAAGE